MPHNTTAVVEKKMDRSDSDVKEKFPVAVKLKESVFYVTCKRVDDI